MKELFISLIKYFSYQMYNCCHSLFVSIILPISIQNILFIQLVLFIGGLQDTIY